MSSKPNFVVVRLLNETTAVSLRDTPSVTELGRDDLRELTKNSHINSFKIFRVSSYIF